ncbi:RagB/SusD family nutrient uptake outer membrane protein [uncultured Alistipes sp.]|uniref:RagB/SusD family nutrient uptake outer membrane protein n=1 Tax=uncultured Alistipes sp. TaxID=538949 RepID=UPI0025E465A8|nr:RagB/SusD family nutrient uptake outer membrane protein [uncultured Alistipes sp.]
MKRNMKHIAWIAAGASMLFTACIGDLDTLPLNPSDSTSETVYGADESGYIAGLTKLYFNFVSNETTDLQVSDAGASELVRAFWTVQEVTSDACKCAWENDAWVRAMNTNTWSDADNDATYAVYVRTLQGIAYTNEYLRQTASDRLSDRGVSSELATKIQGFRAEARFLRAYFYWMALDVFGDVPFTTENSPFGGGVNPKQASRKDVFDYCISELTALAADDSPMPAARSNYPRADKGAVLGLLARMYLNAEVYTGTPMWQEAKDACEDIFTMGYSLCPEYADLFRGDNGENPEALNEVLFGISYDAEQTQSYGGTSYLTLAAIAATDVSSTQMINGVNNGWGGIRVPYEYVEKYFNVRNADYSAGTYDVNDKRGRMFYIKGRSESMDGALYVFLNGWSCLKFNNIPHNMDQDSYLETAASKAYSDIDFPMIRLGEIYLIYAEACMNLGQANTALPKVQELAARAGVTAPTSITQEWLIEERARELMWEGHRRTDLIRYGKFTSSSFLWTYKGGSFSGQGFDDHMKIFAIPASELASNPELHQNPGYGAGTSTEE